MSATELACAACGATDLEQGFVLDTGPASKGFGQWVAGALERGILLGGVKLRGRSRYEVETLRCSRCHFLNAYAHNLVEH